MRDYFLLYQYRYISVNPRLSYSLSAGLFPATTCRYAVPAPFALSFPEQSLHDPAAMPHLPVCRIDYDIEAPQIALSQYAEAAGHDAISLSDMRKKGLSPG